MQETGGALGRAPHFRSRGRRSARLLPRRDPEAGVGFSSVGSAMRATPGDTLPAVPAGRVGARGSPGSPSGAGRDHRAGTEGGDGHERAGAQGCGDVPPQRGLRPLPRRLCLEGGGKPAAAGPLAGRRAAGYRRPPSPPRLLLLDAPIWGGGSRAAPPSRASLGIRRGPRARRGRAGPLPLLARSPPPRVPSGARGAAGSSLRSRSYRGCRDRLAEDKVRGAGGDARA